MYWSELTRYIGIILLIANIIALGYLFVVICRNCETKQENPTLTE